MSAGMLALVDILRCPANHAESALVLSANRWSDSLVSDGQLGCPVCHARYDIHDGVIAFANDGAPTAPTVTSNDPGDPLRLAAQMGLMEGGGYVLLAGAYAAQAAALAELVDVTCLTIDSPALSDHGSIAIQVADRLPLADGVLRAAAITGKWTSPQLIGEVVRTVRAAGRVIAPSDTVLPHGVRDLAQDDVERVAEVLGTPSVLALRRRNQGDPRVLP